MTVKNELSGNDINENTELIDIKMTKKWNNDI